MPEPVANNDSATMLTMLKTDLGISSTSYDTRLAQYLQSAQKEIVREGITFPDTLPVDDMQLIVMYAKWMWLKRESGEGMPRMIRYALNQRHFSNRGEASD